MSKQAKKLKWQRPVDLKKLEDIDEPVGSVTIHFTEDMSHYAVLWQVITGLARKKFASEKEIKEEWLTLLKSYE